MSVKRSLNISDNVKVLVVDSAPVNGTSGTGAGGAGPGSLLIRNGTSPRLYVNRGTKASPSWQAPGQIITIASLGRNGAGSLTLTGAKIGDKVVQAYNVTDLTDSAAEFATEIAADDAISQVGATNLSAKKHIFLLQRP